MWVKKLVKYRRKLKLIIKMIRRMSKVLKLMIIVYKNGNKEAVDKVKPPAPKLDEEAACK